jgi:hypothetical protein
MVGTFLVKFKDAPRRRAEGFAGLRPSTTTAGWTYVAMCR